MSKTNVLSLVSRLGLGLADEIQTLKYYDDATYDIANREIICNIQAITVTAGDATYDFPTEMGQLYAVFFGDRMLTEVMLREMEQRSPQWRDEVGYPYGFVLSDETARTVRLVPTPKNVVTDAFVFTHGAPWGEDFPNDALAMLGTERRDEMPSWMDLFLALGILAREFDRESDHRDPLFAGACLALSNLISAFLIPDPPTP